MSLDHWLKVSPVSSHSNPLRALTSPCSICQRFTANYGYFVTPHVSLVSALDSLLPGWDLSVTWPSTHGVGGTTCSFLVRETKVTRSGKRGIHIRPALGLNPWWYDIQQQMMRSRSSVTGDAVWWVWRVCTISDNVISSWSRTQMETISPHATTPGPWSPQVLISTLIAAPPSSLSQASHWSLDRKLNLWLADRGGGLLITSNMCPHNQTHSRYEENQWR